MKKKMILTALFALAGLLVSGAVYLAAESPVFFSLAVTFGTVFYHLAARLAVGGLIDAKYHNRMDHTRPWFAEKGFERGLYKFLRVRKWKRRLPTFTPENFDLTRCSPAEIVQTSCQAEVVHEINMVFSFVPVVFSVWFGSLAVFLITSCAAFLFDGIFVVMQRYNRPRLLRLMKRQAG